MPRVQAYQPGQVRPAQTTGARFRPAEFSDPGAAIQNFGQALGGFAEVQDRINQELDDTASRKLALDYQTKTSEILSGYKQEQGFNAVNRRKEIEDQLAKIREETIATAKNDRMRAFAEERIAGYHADNVRRVGDHSIGELRKETDATLEAQLNASAESAAASWDSPDILQRHIDTGLAVFDDIGQRQGWSVDRKDLEKQRYQSRIHKNIVDNFLVNEDIEGAETYLEANADNILQADEISLRSALKPVLQERQAFDDYSRAVGALGPIGASAEARGTGGNDATVNVKSLIASAESGGNDKAVNGAGSSASGRYQFVKSTFISLFQDAYGADQKTAEAAWANDRFNVAVQEKLVDRLLDNNGKSLRRAGLPVDNGTLYALHVLGEKKGVELLSADPREPVSNFLSPTIIRQNKGLFGGKTVGEAVEAISKKVDAASPKSSPRRWDKNDVYTRIDTIAEQEGWSPERTERAKSRADREIARDENLLARQESQADRDANELILQLGDSFKSVSQIPADIRDRLSPSDLAKWTKVAEASQKQAEPEANGDIAIQLKLLAINDPEAFKDLSLGEYSGQISRGELSSFATKQAELRRQTPETLNIRSGIVSAIEWGKKYGGVDIKDRDFVNLYDVMEADLKQRFESTGRAPTQAEYNAAFQAATREVKTKRSGISAFFRGEEGSIPRYKLEADNIPADVRSGIVTRFRKVMGREPTEEELGKFYREGKGKYW